MGLASRSVTLSLLVLNAMLYIVIMALAGYVVQMIVDPSINFVGTVSMSGETIYLMTLSLIAGAAGLASALCGFHIMQHSSTGCFNVCLGVAMVAAVLTLEILGLSSKAIHRGLFRNNQVVRVYNFLTIHKSARCIFLPDFIAKQKSQPLISSFGV
ncbi:hypothetical protein KP509_22G070800 [Ceratopteris richardii]|uniref:Uncharacterized protein n=1 Tax=Ceratopteris richardii TaxID=49495 RepID=A0A8T2S8W7_CERRI|nr:hypothetical protein KP509_22G070800 [Ceratopteris richardii]